MYTCNTYNTSTPLLLHATCGANRDDGLLVSSVSFEKLFNERIVNFQQRVVCRFRFLPLQQQCTGHGVCVCQR